MNWHEFDSDKVLSELKTRKEGLTEEEAQNILQNVGYNELKEKKRITPLILFLNQFKSFLVLILVAAAIISYLIENIIDSILIIIIILANALLGFFQEYKAERALESLKKLVAPQARIIRNGKHQIIPAKNLVPGDIIIIEQGDKIPADARIIEVSNLKVDESSLTGESVPVTKTTIILNDVPLAERSNMVYMGTAAAYGRAKAVVVSTGMGTEIGRIAELVQATEQETPLQSKVNLFGKWLGLLALIVAIIAGLIGLVKSYALFDMFLISAALAVSAVPEGLPALLTITLAIGVQRMSRQKAIVRKLSAVEALGATTIIMADKTGTMTTNEMTVRKIFIDDKEINVTGIGYETSGEFLLQRKKLNPKDNHDLTLLLQTVALCNNAILTDDKEIKIIGDPTEAALIIAGKKAGFDYEVLSKEYPRVNEVPFSSERKMMSTVNKVENRCFVYSKGAPEIMLSKCAKILKNSKEVKLTESEKEKILYTVDDFGSRGLRLLATAYKSLESNDVPDATLEENLVFIGLVGMMDPPRAEVKDAIQICSEAGIRVIMVTGDHKNTAQAIAKEIGLLKDGKVISGEELENMSDPQLEEVIESVEVFARVSPLHKSRIVKTLRKKDEIVAVTGDGVNDAPALKDAHIGVAMGIKGTDVAKEASEIILTDDNFATIVKAVEEGRGIYDNIRKFIRYTLSANFDEIFVIAAAILLALPLPFLPIQILWLNLATDSIPALALGFDTKDKNLMKRKPRNPKEGILHKMLPFIISAGILAAIVSLGLFIYELKTSGSIEKARTMVFTVAVVFELFFVFNCRSEEKSVWKINPLSNKLLILGVVVALLLQISIIYTPFLNVLFKTVPLNLTDWLIIVALSSSGLLILPKIFIR